MARTMSKSVRVTDEQWNPVETAAGNRIQSPNHLVVQLAMEALDRREWPEPSWKTSYCGQPCSWPRSPRGI